MATDTRTTTDHEEIRRWVEENGGQPAAMQDTGVGDDPGVLRIDFPGGAGEGDLEHLDWDIGSRTSRRTIWLSSTRIRSRAERTAPSSSW
jgi:hypothetical protein